MAAPRFPASFVNAIRDSKILGIRAGSAPHRFIGIWFVVVDGRIFIRSWSLKQRSWYHTFRAEPTGMMHIEGKTMRARKVRVRAVMTRSERVKDAVSRAYLEKYDTPGSLKFARDLGRKRSRDSTTELVPAR